MEVSVEEIKEFFDILGRRLRYTAHQFDEACRAETKKLKAAHKKTATYGQQTRFTADLAHQDALKKVPELVRNAGGIRFVWLGSKKQKDLEYLLNLYLKLRDIPDAPENDLQLFVKLMLERVLGVDLSQPRLSEEVLRRNLDSSIIHNADTLPIFLTYIRNLFKNRWRDHLRLADPEEVLDLSLQSELWSEIAQGFVKLASDSTSNGLIGMEKFSSLVPTFIQKEVGGTETHHTDFFELLFPGLDGYFQRGVDSFRAGTGLFWIPRKTDLEPDGETLKPIRLFTPTEKTLLAAKYTDAFKVRRREEVCEAELAEKELATAKYREDQQVYSVIRMRSYAKYFITEDYFGPAITEATYNKLRRHIEEALLLEYKFSEDTHAAEITAWISKKEASEGRMRSADDQRDLTYQEKRFVALRALQDDALEVYTAQFLIDYETMSGWSEGLDLQIRKEEKERLKQQVLCLEGIYTDSRVINYTTFDNLMYLLSPENRAATTCAHTIWGRLLFLLCDYDPRAVFDERIEALFGDYLEIARERSRERTFAYLQLIPSRSVALGQDAVSLTEAKSEGGTTDEDVDEDDYQDIGLMRVVSCRAINAVSEDSSAKRGSPIRAYMNTERQKAEEGGTAQKRAEESQASTQTDFETETLSP